VKPGVRTPMKITVVLAIVLAARPLWALWQAHRTSARTGAPTARPA